MVYEAINEFANVVNYKNREEYQKKKRSKKGGVLWQSGMIGVVHTFGRNVGFNPHVHALVPEIKTTYWSPVAISKQGQIEPL